MYQIHQISLPIPYGEKFVFVYLIESEVLTLVDAGIKTAECWIEFNNELKILGYSVEDIKRVILTHHHPDHCGMLDYFSHDYEIYGHEKINKFISKDKKHREWYIEFFEKFDIEMGLPKGMLKRLKFVEQLLALSCEQALTHVIKEGDMISGFKVLETPGHASTHISLYREEDGVLIGGDILLERITPNPIIEAPEHREFKRPKVLLTYLQSIEKLRKLQLNKVYPGHGRIFGNIEDVIEHQIELQQNRSKKVVEIIDNRQLTAFEISKELYPALYRKEYTLTLSQTIGQLDYLMEKELVEMKKEDGVAYYWNKRNKIL